MTACGKDYCRACEASEGRPEALNQFIADAIRESQRSAIPAESRLLLARLLLAGAWIVIIALLWLWFYA